MIEATIKFVEEENGMVNITIVSPPTNETETDRETLMLITFVALNNCLSQKKYLKPLGEILGPEIQKIISGEDKAYVN